MVEHTAPHFADVDGSPWCMCVCPDCLEREADGPGCICPDCGCHNELDGAS
jgi:hypothetical protein